MSETGSIKLKRKFISVISERHQKERMIQLLLQVRDFSPDCVQKQKGDKQDNSFPIPTNLTFIDIY